MAKPKKKRTLPRKKRTKNVIVFDEDARKDYLTGFHKRKKERKKIAIEKAEKRFKDDIKDLKKRRVELMRKVMGKRVPEVEHLIEQQESPQVYELPAHTVTVTEVVEVDLSGTDGLRLGENKARDETEDDSHPETNFADNHGLQKAKNKLKKQYDEIQRKQLKKLPNSAQHSKSRKGYGKQVYTLSKKAKQKQKRKTFIPNKERNQWH